MSITQARTRPMLIALLPPPTWESGCFSRPCVRFSSGGSGRDPHHMLSVRHDPYVYVCMFVSQLLLHQVDYQASHYTLPRRREGVFLRRKAFFIIYVILITSFNHSSLVGALSAVVGAITSIDTGFLTVYLFLYVWVGFQHESYV